MGRPKRIDLPKKFGLQTHRGKYKKKPQKPKKIPMPDFIGNHSSLAFEQRIISLEQILKRHPNFAKFLKKKKTSKETLKTGERIWEWIAKNIPAGYVVEREGKKEKIPYSPHDRTFDVQQIVMPLIIYRPKATDLKALWERIKEGALPDLPKNARREFMVYTLPHLMKTNPKFKDLAHKVDLILLRMIPALKKKKADASTFLKFSLTKIMKQKLSLEELELVADLIETCPDMLNTNAIDDYLHFSLPEIVKEKLRRRKKA